VKHSAYSLDLIKGLMRDGSWFITGAALDTAGELGFDGDDVYDCIVNHLSETHFYKTMPAQSRLGTMQDVYHITYEGVRIYLKLQVRVDAVVISFKEQ
jgi:MqsR (Motility quorum-sensing regulator) toxin of toxin-antitoxin system